MPTPIPELLPQIVTLNVPDQPFSFFAQGNQIIGWWDIAKVTSVYPTQATHADESYRLTVTLNERDGTFDYNEVRTSTEWEAGFTDDGFKLGGEMEWHTGKRVEKSWTFQFGGLNRSSTGGDDPDVGIDPAVYSFETSRIKDQSSAGSDLTAGVTEDSRAGSSAAERPSVSLGLHCREHLCHLLRSEAKIAGACGDAILRHNGANPSKGR